MIIIELFEIRNWQIEALTLIYDDQFKHLGDIQQETFAKMHLTPGSKISPVR